MVEKKRRFSSNIKMELTIRIEQIVCIEDLILSVFYTPGMGWQFSYINKNKKPLKYCGIFSTAAAAESVGRRWLIALLRG